MREVPRLVFGSDWTTGTAALEFRELTSSARQIARYFTKFTADKIFGVVVSPAAAGVTFSAAATAGSRWPQKQPAGALLRADRENRKDHAVHMTRPVRFHF